MRIQMPIIIQLSSLFNKSDASASAFPLTQPSGINRIINRTGDGDASASRARSQNQQENQGKRTTVLATRVATIVAVHWWNRRMTLMAEPDVARCPTSLIPVAEMSPEDWFICSTWSGHETALAEYLARNRVNFFLPMERLKRRKVNGQGREFWVERDRPKFARYLFLNGSDAREEAMLHSRRSTTATCTVTALAKRQQKILHRELVALDLAIKANPYLRTLTGFHVGQHVRICRGPLMGIEGNVERIDHRAIVWLNCSILGRMTPVENVPVEFIEACE